MTAEVFALPGAAVPAQAKLEPNQEVVDFLEMLLAKAKAGELQAIGIATVENVENVGEGFKPSDHPFSHQLMASICDLQWRYMAKRARGYDHPDE